MVESEEKKYSDNEQIQNDHTLWRRIRSDQLIIDSNRGITRPTSAAFEDCPDGDPMSAFWKELHLSKGLTPEHTLYKHDGFFLAGFAAGLSRSLKQLIHLDPIEGQQDPLENQPAHVLVVGSKTKSVSRTLARECRWEIQPP